MKTSREEDNQIRRRPWNNIFNKSAWPQLTENKQTAVFIELIPQLIREILSLNLDYHKTIHNSYSRPQDYDEYTRPTSYVVKTVMIRLVGMTVLTELLGTLCGSAPNSFPNSRYIQLG